MDQSRPALGRKPINQEEKKRPITIYIKQNEINLLGGKAVVRDELLNYLKVITYAKQTNLTIK